MREMKDSGIEWVGTIPAHWSTMPNKYVMRKIKVINPTYNGENILSLTVNGVIVRDLEAGGKMPSSFDGYQILYKGNLLMCLWRKNSQCVIRYLEGNSSKLEIG